MLGLVLTSATVADIDISVRNKPRFSTFIIFFNNCRNFRFSHYLLLTIKASSNVVRKLVNPWELWVRVMFTLIENKYLGENVG